MTIWLAAGLLAVLTLVPLALTLRPRVGARGQREAALALHRAQLGEIDRDLADGRIASSEHAGAVLEIQRRLLGAASSEESRTGIAQRRPVWVALALVPIAAFLLYLTGGSPGMPAMPLKARIANAEMRERAEGATITRLRAALATLDPHSEKAREGYVLIGDSEARVGDLAGAAADWKIALAARFDPTLAVEAAEATTEAEGHVTQEAAALFRLGLARAPADAPWRVMAERRLASAQAPGEAPGLPAAR